ncbi:MAG: energy transducer TonB [Actinomycetota bacterium]
MTAAIDSFLSASALPRRAIALSVGIHVAALLVLPGLSRENGRLELPPLVASLRIPAARQAAATTPLPAPAAESPPTVRQRLPRLVQAAPAAAPMAAPSAARNEVPPAPAQATAAPAGEQTSRNDTPSAAPAPRPAPATVAVEAVVLDDYGRALSELLAHQQQYPRLAALRGWEGEVRLRLRLARKGSLVAVQVVHSSGHEVLDQHALNLVQTAALPAPPDSLGDKEIQVVIPINYKLQKST